MRSRYSVAVIVLAVVYFMFFTQYSIQRTHVWYETRGNYGFDLEVFYYSLLNTIHGDGFFFNNLEFKMFNATSHFGVHNSPVLILLLPLFELAPKIETLLVLQSLFLALSIVMYYLFGLKVMGDEKKALMLAAVYAVNPALHGLNRFEFHPVSFAPLFIFLFAYLYEARKFGIALTFAVLTLSVKEDAGLVLLALSAFYVLRCGDMDGQVVKFNVLISALAIFWMFISLIFVIPHFAPVYGQFRWFAPNVPVKLLSMLLLAMILSFGLLPLLRPKYLLPFPILLTEHFLFANKTNLFIFWNHYEYMIITYLAIVTVYVVKEKNLPARTLLYALAIAVLTFFISSPAVYEGFPLVFGIRIPYRFLILY